MLIILAGFLSCYDGLGDTYDNDTVYKIGDTGPAGGWIFYVNPDYRTDGWRYLEVAPYDQSTGAPGSLSTSTWVFTNEDTGKGYGDANTELIIAAVGNTGVYAAKLCADLDIDGYDDWYLPTPPELLLIYNNLYLQGIGNLGPYLYWTSVWGYTDDSTNYWGFSFSTGASTQAGRTTSQHVRAVRYF